MRFMETGIVGAWVIDPTPHQDDRGQFQRAWCAKEFAEHGVDFVPVQANMAFGIAKGTIRGMHMQDETAIEAKLRSVHTRGRLRRGYRPPAGVADIRRMVWRGAECR